MIPDGSTFYLRFWGVTGTFANPLPPHAVTEKVLDAIHCLSGVPEFRQRVGEFASNREALAELLTKYVPFSDRTSFGGNTTCIELRTPDSLLIIDSGTGLRRLGEALVRAWNAPEFTGQRVGHVLLTHAHMDHTFATPFFDPYYDARNEFHIWAPGKVLKSLHAVLSPDSALRSIYFPPTYELLGGIKQFTTIQAGEELTFGRTHVTTFALRHPGGSLAYRFELDGRVVVIATDHEHAETPDRELAEFARGADLLYIDAQYLRDEYDGLASIADEPPMKRHGWGHSTVESVVATAVEARAKRVLLGHHDPKRTDAGLAHIEAYARRLLSDTLREQGLPSDTCELAVAREGSTEII